MKNYLLLFVTAILIFSCGCVSSENLCDIHETGESWPAKDGCNTCYCTETGIACTEIACLEKCETAQDCEERENSADKIACEGEWSCVSGMCQYDCHTEENPFECTIDEECLDVAMTISHCPSIGKCVDNTCIFECINELHPNDPSFETEEMQTRFDYSEGECMEASACVEAGEGCGGGHSTCTNDPEKYEGMMSTCDINPDHPTNNGYSCTCVIEENKCGWVKD